VKDALHSIGEGKLENQFEEAAQKIKRDVIFAASLYL
jgi:superfamily II RNA helicase